MGRMIEDGSGNGYKAKVDSDLNLHTLAITQSSIRSQTTKGLTFGTSTSVYTAGSNIVASGGVILHIENTDTTMNFHIDSIYFYWNGGDTSKNVACEAQIQFGHSDPTANHAVSALGNMNRSSGNEANASVWVWDGTNTAGMTISGGGAALYGVFPPAFVPWPIDGAIVLGKGDTMSLWVKPDEVGRFAFNFLGYYV